MKHRYLLFNKPYDVLCQFSGEEPDHPTLKRYIPATGVYPAGRLDQDSEGLVLLTSDGQFQHAVTDPKFEHPRTYWVQVENIPGEAALNRLRNGFELRGYHTRQAQVKLLPQPPDLWPRNPPVRFRAAIPTAWLEMTLTEGRNRQVRRMTAAVDHPTLRLVRVAIGSLKLGELKPGEYRDLTASELARTAREVRLM